MRNPPVFTLFVVSVVVILSIGFIQSAAAENKAPAAPKEAPEQKLPAISSGTPVPNVAPMPVISAPIAELAMKVYISVMESRNRAVEAVKVADKADLKGVACLLRALTASDEFCSKKLELILMWANIPSRDLLASYVPKIVDAPKANLEAESKNLTEFLKLCFPGFIKTAKEGNSFEATRVFEVTLQVLESQAKAIAEAIAVFDKIRSVECEFFVCVNCGYMTCEKKLSSCPCCKAEGKNIKKYY